MTCKTCKHWFDNGTDLSSCDRDALLREADFFCAAWEEEPILRVETHHVKPTNGDVMRGMTDYDLANWIAEILTYHGAFSSYQDWDFERKCIGCPLEKCCNDQPSDNIEDWLKLPADKEETE